MWNYLQNVNLRGVSVIFIDESVMFTKKWRIVLQYLFNLDKFHATTILTYGLNR